MNKTMIPVCMEHMYYWAKICNKQIKKEGPGGESAMLAMKQKSAREWLREVLQFVESGQASLGR